MKRHVQIPGVRQWAGEDLVELQSEPLKAIDLFFSQYEPCIIQGCQTTDNGNNTYTIAPGLLSLVGVDINGSRTFKVVPFAGIAEVSLPVYFSLGYSVIERSYLDGHVKPVAYNYRAEISTVEPEGEFLELSESSNIRFVDVIQCDSVHRFFTDTERRKLEGIATGANNYTHPSSHPASMILEGTDKLFMTAKERNVLSTLGTTYAKADLSNVITKSLGLNGYYKFPDGLLMQWGYSNSSGVSRRINFPISFYNDNYSITMGVNGGIGTITSLSIIITERASTYIKVKGTMGDSSSTHDNSFYWIAIGRWK